MKVGEYVRTNRGYIYKLGHYDEKEERWICFEDDDWFPVYESEVKISSPNIIDLIEVGDIVELEESDDIACMFFRDIYRIKNEDNLFHIVDNIKNNKCKLLSIITKEQFSQMEYRIGE